MRRAIALVLVLALGLLALGGCSAGASNKLIGTWTMQDGATRTWSFRADGTWSDRWSETEPGYDGRYTLEADKLTIFPAVGEDKMVSRIKWDTDDKFQLTNDDGNGTTYEVVRVK